MKRINFIMFIVLLVFVVQVFSQSANPRPPRTTWKKELDYIQNGTMTFTYKTLTSPTITSPTFTGASILTTTNALTSGTYRSFSIGHTQSAATSGVIEALRVNIDANVATGDWTNALVARVDYGASGNANGGMVAPFCAELSLPPASLSGGAYYVADLEIEAPENYVSHGNVNYPTAYLNIATYGNATAIGSLEDNAFLFRTDGFTSASGNMIYNNTIRALVEGTTWYLPLSSAQGEFETAYLIDVTNTTDASSLTAASIQTDGGLAVAKQIFLGDDLDMSVSGTGVYDITLKDGVADALSIVRGTTDVIVFDTSTPKVTITPAVDITGLLTTAAGINLGTSQAIVGTTGLTIGNNGQTVAINSSDWDIDATGVMTGIGNITSNGTYSTSDDQVFTLGTTTTNAATKLTMEFDETTTGIGLFNIGDLSNPQVLNVNPGASVAASTININHSAGAGDCDDLLGTYSKVNVIGDGDAGITIVGDASRAYVGLTGGANNSVASQAYGTQAWARHGGTGAITAMSGLSAKLDVGAENFTASTANAGHFHIDGAADVTGQYDGVMIEAYPDVDVMDALLALATDSGADVAAGIRITGAPACQMLLSSGAKVFTGTAANGDAVYGEVGAIDAVGSIYINATNGYIYIQVANAGNESDWYKVTASNAD